MPVPSAIPVASEVESAIEGKLMKYKVFVGQPIARVALEILRPEAEVTVYPYLDRQITEDELIANAKRNDWLLLASDNMVPASVINANPALQGIATVSRISRSRGWCRRRGSSGLASTATPNVRSVRNQVVELLIASRATK